MAPVTATYGKLEGDGAGRDATTRAPILISFNCRLVSDQSRHPPLGEVRCSAGRLPRL